MHCRAGSARRKVEELGREGIEGGGGSHGAILAVRDLAALQTEW